MKRSLPWILLVVSLLVNAGFVYGAWQAQQQAEALTQATALETQVVLERLELTEAQHQALEQTRQALQERRLQDREDPAREERQRQVMGILLEADYDREAVRAMLMEDSERRVERWLDMGKEVHHFLQQLEADQQQVVLELTESHRGWLRALFFPRPPAAGD